MRAQPPGSRVTADELAAAVYTTVHAVHTAVSYLRAEGRDLRCVRAYEVPEAPGVVTCPAQR
jgi:stage V sporulation protein SpoVS